MQFYFTESLRNFLLIIQKGKLYSMRANKVINKQSFFLIHFVIFFFALKKYLFLGRFPNQDLFWNDLQLFRHWTWLSKTFDSQGIVGVLGSDTDFLTNYGESLYAQAKSTSFIFDFGSWIYVFTGDVDIAIGLRLLVFSSIGALGLYLLLIKGSRADFNLWSSKILFLFLFIIFDSFLLFHPQFSYEVGILNSWCFFLVPMWIYMFWYGGQYSNLIRVSTLIALSYLSFSTTDIHAIIYILILALFCLISVGNRDKVRILKDTILLSGLFLIDRIPFLVEFFRTSETSFRGAFYPDYLVNFVLYLGLTPFAYNFAGPVTLFIGFLAPFVAIWIYLNSNINQKKKLRFELFTIIFIFLILIFIGICLHSISILSAQMPSLWRYPLAILPFIIISTLARRSGDFFSNCKLKYSFVAGIVISLTLQLAAINFFTRDVHQVVYDKELRNHLVEKLPKCINEALLESKIAVGKRSIIFAAQEYSEDYPKGRDDTLLYLNENPTSLQGRTFNQWRYSSNSLYIDQFGFFAWPFILTNTDEIVSVMDITRSNVLLTSSPLINNSKILKFVRICEPLKLDQSFTVRNKTLERNVYVYLKTNNINFIDDMNYSSSRIQAKIDCSKISQLKENDFVIPLAFRDSLKADINQTDVVFKNHKGYAQLPYNICNSIDEVNLIVDIHSKSTTVLLKNIIGIALTLIALIYLAYVRLRPQKSFLN
jgi:hypothetical protein